MPEVLAPASDALTETAGSPEETTGSPEAIGGTVKSVYKGILKGMVL